MAIRDKRAFNKVFGDSLQKDPKLDKDNILNLYPSSTYAFYFKKAADLLYREWLKPGADESLVYPLIFLLRHCVELSLKDAIVELKVMNKRESTIQEDRIYKKHDLRYLSKKLEKEFRLSGIPRFELKGVSIEDISCMLSDWEEADPNGEIFRYAMSNEGNLRIPKIVVNPKRIYNWTGLILNWLSVVVDKIIDL